MYMTLKKREIALRQEYNLFHVEKTKKERMN